MQTDNRPIHGFSPLETVQILSPMRGIESAHRVGEAAPGREAVVSVTTPIYSGKNKLKRNRLGHAQNVH
jgi:hypothetical protein